MTYLAVSVAIGDWDSITSQGGQAPNNHFWYHRADTNRLEIIPWDPGVSFGNWTGNANNWRDDGAPFTVEMSAFFRFSSTAATSWTAADPATRAKYLERLRQVVTGPLSTVTTEIDAIYQQIRNDVYQDRYKPFSNAEFDAAVMRIKSNWVPRRLANLRGQIEAITAPQ